MTLYRLLSAPLFRFVEPEAAHRLAVVALKLGVVPRFRAPRDPRLRVQLLGLDFPSPIGMAAGFDKNAEVPDALLKRGFGFTEVGTVTPRPQDGNPRPRVFRLAEDRAVINRLGFNNAGHDAAKARLLGRRRQTGIVGVNVGANKDAEDRVADYVAGIHTFASLASYFAVNVSSPNTPGLRDLQARDALDELLTRVLEARDEEQTAGGRRVPVLLKIAPDLAAEGLTEVAEVVLARGVDGLIVSNTTLSRDGLTDVQAAEQGGMSGAPLFDRATAVLARARQLVGPDLPIIGVGGVMTGDDVFEKLSAGANLVQLYTGFIYGGPATAARITRELLDRMQREGVTSVSEISGRSIDAWAARAPR